MNQTERIEEIKEKFEFLNLESMKEIQNDINTIVKEMVELNIQ